MPGPLRMADDVDHAGVRVARQLEVVDLAAQPSVAVAQLAVEEVERGVEDPAGGHQAPALVMIISGIVASATSTRMTR